MPVQIPWFHIARSAGMLPRLPTRSLHASTTLANGWAMGANIWGIRARSSATGAQVVVRGALVFGHHVSRAGACGSVDRASNPPTASPQTPCTVHRSASVSLPVRCVGWEPLTCASRRKPRGSSIHACAAILAQEPCVIQKSSACLLTIWQKCSASKRTAQCGTARRAVWEGPRSNPGPDLVRALLVRQSCRECRLPVP